MEIERKYLVARLTEGLESFEHVEIEQGYLLSSPTLRVRRMGDDYILTVKEHIVSDSSAIHNREEEFSLTAEAYQILRDKCDNHLVCKTRYKIPLNDTGRVGERGLHLIAELDIFHYQLEGLIVVEVEFPDTASADTFVPPDWFGDDVSDSPIYRNTNLAKITQWR